LRLDSSEANGSIEDGYKVSLSIVIATFNEAANILGIIESICKTLNLSERTEIVVVDENSPDGTARLVEEYCRNSAKLFPNCEIKVIRRRSKLGLASAIMNGIQVSSGQNVVVMDSDFSHPPEIINEMLVELRRDSDIVIGSRYVKGGSIQGWNFKRYLMSRSASPFLNSILGTILPMGSYEYV